MEDPLDVEELVAEEEDVGFVQSVNNVLSNFRSTGIEFIGDYGWILAATSIAIYFLWKNYSHHIYPNRPNNPAPTAQEICNLQSKEEARQRYVAKMQEQYEKEATVRAEKLKQKEDEKRQARFAELEKLTGNTGGRKLGTKEDKQKPLRPEYNPLMGDTTSYSRPCNRSSGRSGG